MAQTAGGVLRRGSNRVIAGVCSGLGQYFGVDAVIMRLIFVLLALVHGVGILLYFILWLLMDPATGSAADRNLGQRFRAMGDEIAEDFRTGFSRSQPASSPSGDAAPQPPGEGPTPPPTHPYHHRGLWIGVVLILIGAYFLLDNLGLLTWFRWDLFWPVLIIVLGLLLLVRRR